MCLLVAMVLCTSGGTHLRSVSIGVGKLIEVLGTLLIAGALAIGSVGTPILCLSVGAWRSRSLVHVGIGWGLIVGFGVGIGALVTNIAVAVAVHFVLVDAAPVVSGDWRALWVAVSCPYLTAPLAVLVTWKICIEKKRGEQALVRSWRGLAGQHSH